MSLSKIRVFLKTRPILTNTLVFVGLYAAGDISVQTFIYKNEKYDWKSTARISLVAACYFGPVYPPYYSWLDRFWPGTAPRILAKKLLFDQGVMGLIGSVVFFAGTSFLEGKGNVWQEVKEKAPKAYLVGFAYWPLAQLINFKFLPTYLRSAYVAVAAFAWTNFLCYLKHKRVASHTETTQKEILV